MKEYFDPIDHAKEQLPLLVRDYIELSDEIAHDPQDKAEKDEVRFNLIDSIYKDETLNKALGEFVIFRNDTLKQREGERQ